MLSSLYVLLKEVFRFGDLKAVVLEFVFKFALGTLGLQDSTTKSKRLHNILFFCSAPVGLWSNSVLITQTALAVGFLADVSSDSMGGAPGAVQGRARASLLCFIDHNGSRP